jgi:hypothetical protein
VTDSNKQPKWATQCKTIRQLIKELQTFENQELEVQISLDEGKSHKPMSIVGKYGNYCLLVNSEIQAKYSYVVIHASNYQVSTDK